VTPKTTDKILEKIRKLTIKNNLEYVRLLPDCVQSYDKIIEGHKKTQKIAEKLGPPFFHQYKIPSCPKNCYLGYFHPVLYCDGNIYPCDSLILNDHGNLQFKDSFMICKAEDIGNFYDRLSDKSLVDTRKECPNCVFERQNNLLSDIKDRKVKIPERNESNNLKHVNFI
jgi:MoaA/NifB/PqqE/SkfB family radical SAM enzyme